MGRVLSKDLLPQSSQWKSCVKTYSRIRMFSRIKEKVLFQILRGNVYFQKNQEVFLRKWRWSKGKRKRSLQKKRFWKIRMTDQWLRKRNARSRCFYQSDLTFSNPKYSKTSNVTRNLRRRESVRCNQIKKWRVLFVPRCLSQLKSSKASTLLKSSRPLSIDWLVSKLSKSYPGDKEKKMATNDPTIVIWWQ